MTNECALPLFPPTPAWYPAAACAGMGADLFHPPPVRGRPRGGDRPLAAAKAICARCPVRTECLDEAMNLPAKYDLASGAVRGGLSAAERHRPGRAVTAKAWRARRKEVAA